jgi:hypothetical protein
MKTTHLILVTLILSSITLFGQTFEGKIVYTNTYKSKIPNVTDKQFTEMMGELQEYYIKNGDYKSETKSALFQAQYYINSDNKLYTKMANSDEYIWNDGAINDDELIKSEYNKGVIEILGNMCDELIFTCKKSRQKYYFSSKFSANSQLFVNHKFGNWYDFVSKSNAVPLKMIIDNEEFSMESTATSITEMKLENSFFTLPANAKTVKSPY